MKKEHMCVCIYMCVCVYNTHIHMYMNKYESNMHESFFCTFEPNTTLQINYTSIFKSLHPNHSFLAHYYMTKVSP